MPAEREQKQDRLSLLARPKVNHQILFCRPTIYWVDKIPKEPPQVTVPVLTSRQEELSQAKKVNSNFQSDRPTAVWPVSRAALRAEPSSRVKELAEPRLFIDDWALSRPRLPLVSKGALSATPSQRLVALAVPRRPPPSASAKPPKKVPRGPVANVAKFEELSRPRIYTFEGQNAAYRVSKAALQYMPSPRILEISRPLRVRAKVGHGP